MEIWVHKSGFFFNVSNVKIFNNVPKFNKTLALLEGQEKEWANPVMSLVVTGSAQLVPQEPEFYTCSQCLLLLSDVSCENKWYTHKENQYGCLSERTIVI